MANDNIGSFQCPHCAGEVSVIRRDYDLSEIAIVGDGRTAATIGFRATGSIPVITLRRKRAAKQSSTPSIMESIK
jgi:hypothetical protein